MKDETSGAVMGALNGEGSANPVFDGDEDADGGGNVSPDCCGLLPVTLFQKDILNYCEMTQRKVKRTTMNPVQVRST